MDPVDWVVGGMLGLVAVLTLRGLYHLTLVFRMTRPTPKEPAPPEAPKPLLCPRCRSYYMLFNGIVPEPGAFQHECPCGHRLNLRHTVFVPKEQPERATGTR